MIGTRRVSRRRAVAALAVAPVALADLAELTAPRGTTFVLVHGAWHRCYWISFRLLPTPGRNL